MAHSAAQLLRGTVPYLGVHDSPMPLGGPFLAEIVTSSVSDTHILLASFPAVHESASDCRVRQRHDEEDIATRFIVLS